MGLHPCREREALAIQLQLHVLQPDQRLVQQRIKAMKQMAASDL
jgi:hypothetical protein